VNIPVHHYDDSKAHAYLRGCHYHNKENKQLPITTAIRGQVTRLQCYLVMHFGKCNQQEVHRIQHQFHAHEYDNGIPACQHTYDPDREQGNGQKYVIINWQLEYFINR
jgi:hypothetical protein